MQQSCTRRSNCFFPVNKVENLGEGGGGGYQNYNAVFRSNATELYSSTKAIVSFLPVNKVEKGEEEEEEEDIRTTMQSSVAMQQSCTRQPRQLFLSSKQGVEDGGLEGGGGNGEGGGGGGGGGGRGRRGEGGEEEEEEEEEEEVDIQTTM